MSRDAKDFLLGVLPLEGAGDGLESFTAAPDPAEAILPQGPVPEEHQSAVERTAGKIAEDRPLDRHEDFILEAIIIPDKRPAVTIRGGDYQVEHPMWMHLNGDAAKASLRAAIPSVGRIELPDNPGTPYGGTGFVVGEGLVMTNRHVAEIFCSGLGRSGLLFSPGQTAAVDFLKEADSDAALLLHVRDVAMIHPYWDMALLRVEGLPPGVRPLRLSTAAPETLVDHDVAVIGYPAFDPRNRSDVQNQVFGGVYDVKRLMPGKLTGRASIRSFGKDVASSLHDSSTLGGASGSAVIDVASGEIVALHFAGIYLKTNYGVPTADLARDPRLVDAGLNFTGPVSGAGAGPWDNYWAQTESRESTAVQVPANLPAVGPATATGAVSLQAVAGGTRVTIPIEISIDIGTPVIAVAAPPASAEGSTERPVEPFHQEDYSNRRGYDPAFLGLDVPLPEVTDADAVALLEDGSGVVPYHHFSLAMHRRRRLAIFTAANVDASPARRKPDPKAAYGRKALSGLGETDMERWFTDPRLRGLDQLPDKFFDKDSKAFDKGHLVRRDDVAWGDTYQELQAANGDTFHTTNCSPQVGNFNRSNLKGLWGRLENDVLGQAAAERLSYFAGPVLKESDRLFSGVDDGGKVKIQIPEEYWKLILSNDGGTLRAFAFVLRQDLSNVELEFTVAPEWAGHMVSVADLEKKLGIVRFPDVVHSADQFGVAQP
ncbi:MAG TPA: DNA/RNA non-specific endonuclease [Allosphingosinicella sp.]|jgi:endonuclease G